MSSNSTSACAASLLVNERDARHMLGGLCAKTMYNLRRSGALVGVKIGTRTLYDVADLRAFVDRQKGDHDGR
jgi:hypothetical protein